MIAEGFITSFKFLILPDKLRISIQGIYLPTVFALTFLRNIIPFCRYSFKVNASLESVV